MSIPDRPENEPYDDPLRDQFEEELNRMRENTILSPAYRRKKILIWIVRTAIAAAAYYFLWEYKWIRWTLLIYVPVSLVSLLSIVGWSILLNRKIDQTRQQVDEFDRSTEDIDYEELE